MRFVAIPVRVAILTCLLAAGCLPQERLNDSCRWTDHTVVLPPPGNPARRAHLVEDVRVAQWLGIRYGDVVVGRVYNDAHRRARAQCTDASMAEIRRRHAVSAAEIAGATGAREPWVDLVAVFLPMTALFLVFSRLAIGHILAGYDPADRGVAIAVLVAFMPIVVGFGLGITHMWSWLVETMRLRDAHISYRASYLPVARHAWLFGTVALGLFAALAVLAVRQSNQLSHPARRTSALVRLPTRRTS